MEQHSPEAPVATMEVPDTLPYVPVSSVEKEQHDAEEAYAQFLEQIRAEMPQSE